MIDYIVLKELIRVMAVSSTTTDLGNFVVRSIVKDAGTIVKTGKRNVQCLLCHFSYGGSDRTDWDHAEVLMIKDI